MNLIHEYNIDLELRGGGWGVEGWWLVVGGWGRVDGREERQNTFIVKTWRKQNPPANPAGTFPKFCKIFNTRENFHITTSRKSEK